MLLVNALKTVADYIFFYIFACAIPSYKEAKVLMCTVLILAFVSSLLLQKVKDIWPLKLLCGLMPALGLFTANRVSDIIITSVFLAFYLFLTVEDKNELYYEDYKYWFGITGMLAIFMAVPCYISGPDKMNETKFWAVTYIFMGMLILRRKRIGAGAGLKVRFMNVFEVAATVGIGAAISAVVFGVISLLQWLVELILIPFGFIFYSIVNLITMIVNDHMEEKREIVAAEVSEQLHGRTQDIPGDNGYLGQPPNSTMFFMIETFLRIMLFVLIFILVAFILYCVYNMVRNLGIEKDRVAGDIEEGNNFILFGKRRKKNKRNHKASSNNEKIRNIYREFLALSDQYGLDIVRQTTTEDVLMASEGLAFYDESKQLRELYIRARYQDAIEVDSAEVDRAKELVKDIKQQLENKYKGF